MRPFDFHPRSRVIFGAGTLSRIGERAHELGITRVLIVADRGIAAVGYVDAARRALEGAGIAVETFHEFTENPDADMVEAGRAHAAALDVNGIVGLGGGSSMDCAKGINFLLTNGGAMADYRGYGKASRPMLPMIGVPTTAGTGSDAQSYALISDARTHVKMACGDAKAAFSTAILDPELTTSQPAHVTSAAGYDAIAHAVETWVTRTRNPMSDLFAREAWRLLEGSFERVLRAPRDLDARGAMLVGSHLAGAAIEQSMLGATHACANPLTARYGTTHGVAIALLLRHVVQWNSSSEETRARYVALAPDLPARLEALAHIGQFPAGLAAAGVSEDDLDMLAHEAAAQRTGTFNPRPFDEHGAREIYEMAW
jgi:alcohol dehydrogenase